MAINTEKHRNKVNDTMVTWIIILACSSKWQRINHGPGNCAGWSTVHKVPVKSLLGTIKLLSGSGTQTPRTHWNTVCSTAKLCWANAASSTPVDLFREQLDRPVDPLGSSSTIVDPSGSSSTAVNPLGGSLTPVNRLRPLLKFWSSTMFGAAARNFGPLHNFELPTVIADSVPRANRVFSLAPVGHVTGHMVSHMVPIARCRPPYWKIFTVNNLATVF